MGESLLMNGARVELVVRVDAAHFLLGAQLSHRLHDWAHIDVGDLYTPVVVDLESLVDDLGRALDRKTLVRALARREALIGSSISIHASLFSFFLKLSVLVCKREQILVILDLVAGGRVCRILVQFDRRHKGALGQKRVDLLDELQRGVLLVEDERIDGAKDNRNLSAVEEKL